MYLPPLEFQVRPKKRLETPVDDLGLVDIPKLIDIVKSTVVPEYVWPMGRRYESTHHLYYEEEKYPYGEIDGVSPGVFRELPLHKIELPRPMHNWLHIVMDEPKRPESQVMQNRIIAWRAAHDLFASAREIIQWQRRGVRRAEYVARNPEVISHRKEGEGTGDYIALECIAEILDKHFTGVQTHMSNLRKVPPEFRLVEPSNTPQELAASLGKVVVPRSLKVGRYVHQDIPELLAA